MNGNTEEINGNKLYTYDNEKVTPYCYSVTLDEHDIDVKFVPAEKSGLFVFNSMQDSAGGAYAENNNAGGTYI